MTDPAHRQASYDVRLDWGPTGAAAIVDGADLAVVVDVLSFTTTLGIAVARGTRVHPFPWKDERAAAFAEERGAVLAVGRLEAGRLRGAGYPVDRVSRGLSASATADNPRERPTTPPPSLSPAMMLESPPVDRLVLPSPNGSTICAALAGPVVVGASLRTRSAVARWLAPRVGAGSRLALVAAGERWPDGSLRPSLEDLWGAGAVLDALLATVGRELRLSPEAEHAAASYRLVADRIPAVLADCASGRELADAGYAEDVAAAAQVDADDVVPVLTDDGFVAG